MTIQGVKQRFGIIGTSPELDRAIDTAMRVASTDLSVLVQGQSGVGKESFSKIIHQLSQRKHNQFIAVNCGAIPSGTINSELFGHEKGAFTGAVSDRKGYFETVDGGTIFLDEIGEMPLDTQAFLLRILESGEFQKVGSSKTSKTNVRIVAATNVNLEDKIKKNQFREDLYYRLNTVPIKVPSLVERRQDIALLFRKFAYDFSEKYRTDPIRLSDSARLVIENYSWPGNIRELRNLAEQLSVMTVNRLLDAEELYELAPKLKQRNLPAQINPFGDFGDFSTGDGSLGERDILYRLLFDMRHDLGELKQVLAELIANNNLQVSPKHLNQLEDLQVNPYSGATRSLNPSRLNSNINEPTAIHPQDPKIIFDNDDFPYDSTAEIVEESLSLEEMEISMIKKALEKHNNRRKDAAVDLGISERTLYRKIKQYDI